MRVPRRLEQGHSLFQSWFGDDLSILFVMCGLANACMLLQNGGSSERLGFDGFGGMSTGSSRARKRLLRWHSHNSGVPKMAMIVHSQRIR
jgi:hypothetical protein